MTPTEISTFNALPPEARAALSTLPGPGWLVTPEGVATPCAERPVIWQEGLGLGWCPADPMAVLRVAAEAKGAVSWTMREDADGDCSVRTMTATDPWVWGPECETRLLAALGVFA